MLLQTFAVTQAYFSDGEESFAILDQGCREEEPVPHEEAHIPEAGPVPPSAGLGLGHPNLELIKFQLSATCNAQHCAA